MRDGKTFSAADVKKQKGIKKMYRASKNIKNFYDKHWDIILATANGIVLYWSIVEHLG